MSVDLSSIVFQAVRQAVSPAAATTPIRVAVAAYRRSMIDRGRSARHAKETAIQCRRVCVAGKIETIAELSEERVVRGIARLRRRRPGREGNEQLSTSTGNHYRNSLRGFSRWLYQSRQLAEHVLARMPEFRGEEKKRCRRELSIDDVEKLLAAAERGPRVEGMSGPDRAWMYRIALATGLRRGEISSLRPSSFIFEPAAAFVVCEANFSKRRRKELQPLNAKIVDALNAWLATRPPADLVWPVTKASGGAERKTSKMIASDLKRAGIPYRDERASPTFTPCESRL